MTLFELLELLKKHLRFVVGLTLICGLIVGIVCAFLPNEYTATTSMYVLSKSSDQDSSSSVTYSDLSAGQMLTNDVATILESDRVKADVAEEMNLDNLDDFDIDVTSSTTTRVITLSVTGRDPDQTAQVANALAKDVSDVAAEVMNIQSVNSIDAAQTPESPSGPRRGLYTLVGLLAGLFIAIAVVVLRDMLDTRVRSSHEVEELVGLPVVGHFPELGRM